MRVDEFSWPRHELVSSFSVSCFCLARRAPSRVKPSSDPRTVLKRANAEAAWLSVTALYCGSSPAQAAALLPTEAR